MSHPTPPAWRLFWAKTARENRDSPDYDETWTRPLWAHLLDVGHTALLLWERAVPAPLRRAAADHLGLDETGAGHALSLQVGLHDWGKATPSFQEGHRPTRDALEGAGLTVQVYDRVHHGHATIALLHQHHEASGVEPVDRAFWTHFGAFVGFHHGWLCSRDEWERYARSGEVLGKEYQGWSAAQADLHREVTAAWRRRYPHPAPPRPVAGPLPDWLLGLAGWATYADWLGSVSACFPRDVEAGDDLDAYVDRSREGADKALRLVGLDTDRGAAPSGLVAQPFGDLFRTEDDRPFEPNPLQALVTDPAFPGASETPTLTIIEAPTGEGKTEAALALAARQQDGRGGGLYLALPTQATSNGLFERAVRFLKRAHVGGPADFRLAHGHAQLHEGQGALREAPLTDPAALDGIADDGAGRGDARVRTLDWFLSSKRALLAPYGLGTVDQAMLGALRGRHFFLRLYGLAGKTVVIDEVHAYDVYMQEIIGRLVGWLRALGAHVVVLSATLPARLRSGLVRAWDAGATPPPGLPAPAETPYPAVWTVADGAVALHAGADLTASRTQTATLRRHDPDPEAVAEVVAEAVRAGAVVGVILNTVARAQAVFEAVEQAAGDLLGDGDLVLFHARFLLRDRQRIERAVVGHRDPETGARVPGRFGKGRPAGPAVLVATQVAEQSLDLDVDLLVTDLAPVDLILQRAGRLHRHTRGDRPDGYAEPHVVWLCPDAPPDGLPAVRTEEAPFGFVYDPVVLWRTWRLLRSREDAGGAGRWSLPDDYRPLIEAVYPSTETETATPPAPSDLSPEAAAVWEKAASEGRGGRLTSIRHAERQTIPTPGELEDLLDEPRGRLHDEDDEEAHRLLRAATREGDSVEVVVFHGGEGDGLFLDAEGTPAPLALPGPGRALPTESVRAVLGASVRLSQPGLVAALRARPDADLPAPWRAAAKTTPALRTLHPLVLENGSRSVGNRRVRFDARLGVLVEKKSD